MKLSGITRSKVLLLPSALLLLLLILEVSSLQESGSEGESERRDGGSPEAGEEEADEERAPEEDGAPKSEGGQRERLRFVRSASYIALDGLSLVLVLDRAVDLERLLEESEGQPEAGPPMSAYLKRARAISWSRFLEQCPPSAASSGHSSTSSQPILRGVQLCAKLLSEPTLRLLNKYKLRECLWSSRVQFIIRLLRPVSESQLPVSFRSASLRATESSSSGTGGAGQGEEELSIELSKIPLESLGLPLAPRVALTGPNQVPPCGQFALSAHLSSPYGTASGDSVRLEWSVSLVGGVLIGSTRSASNSSASSVQASEQVENKWRTLQKLVASNKGNNLLLEAKLLNQQPQLYEFKLSVSFATSLTRINLNASHQVSRLDFEAPIGTVYGSHMLGQQQSINTNQDVLLLADVQVPECASNVKQVGLYWQVSEPRVRFEQTYAPYYLARPNSLPEQSNVEFRLNSFYGIRVKKYASSGSLISTGDAVLDASISDGLLVMALAGSKAVSRKASGGELATSSKHNQLVLHATGSNKPQAADKFTYLWSCFDGKTGQPCFRSSGQQGEDGLAGGGNNTRYELANNKQLLANSDGHTQLTNGSTGSGLLILDKSRQRQPVLRIPLEWLEPEAQLWFGLQRFDRLIPSQHSRSEYALVSMRPAEEARSPAEQLDRLQLSVGPVLVGSQRHRATVRNPLTGAVLLPPDTGAVVVGRLGPSRAVRSFAWQAPNLLQTLAWTTKSARNPLTEEEELESELHIPRELLVSHAHLQVHLSACDQSGRQTLASLNLDVLEGVSQCRLELASSRLAGSLALSVEFCNIPLGLSPLTYQLHLAESGQNASRETESRSEQQLLAGQLELDGAAKPLSVPQLSPVFWLTDSMAASLASRLAGVESANRPEAEGAAGRKLLHLGARVCDRLQACRSFYSSPLKLAQLLPQEKLAAANLHSSGATKASLELIESLHESARRANLAGNSIAAISVLNGAIELAWRALLARDRATASNNAPGKPTSQPDDRWQPDGKATRELLAKLVKDSLQFAYQSSQRQLHYTDSGQTSLATEAMANIVALREGNIEQKYRAIRLLGLITRRSIAEELNLKTRCLAEPRALQTAFQSIFGTFSHYHVQRDPQPGRQQSGAKKPTSSSGDPFKAVSVGISNSSSSPLAGDGAGRTSSSSVVAGKDVVVGGGGSRAANDAGVMAPPPLHSAGVNKPNRRKREEAILAYLRSVRQAFRSLISAAAIQLPLGASQQLHYKANNSPDLDRQDPDSKLSTSRSRPSATSSNHNNNNNNQLDKGATLLNDASRQPKQQQKPKTTTSSDILSSISHLSSVDLSSLLAAEIDLNLHEFGSIRIHFHEGLSRSLSRQLESQRVSCTNDTAPTKCSSLVLAITSFAGKAPFRALDEALSLPALEVSFLSPVDGSNLLDLLPSSSKDGATEGEPLARADFKIFLTFNTPQENNEASNYKCYAFDEDSNEWREKPQEGLAWQQLPSGRSDSGGGVRCAFDTLGAFAAFRGKPPAAETAVTFSLALGLVLAFGLAGFLSLLGCFASSSRERRRKSSLASDDSSDQNSSHKMHSSEETDSQEAQSLPRRSHRSNFNS